MCHRSGAPNRSGSARKNRTWDARVQGQATYGPSRLGFAGKCPPAHQAQRNRGCHTAPGRRLRPDKPDMAPSSSRSEAATGVEEMLIRPDTLFVTRSRPRPRDMVGAMRKKQRVRSRQRQFGVRSPRALTGRVPMRKAAWRARARAVEPSLVTDTETDNTVPPSTQRGLVVKAPAALPSLSSLATHATRRVDLLAIMTRRDRKSVV